MTNFMRVNLDTIISLLKKNNSMKIKELSYELGVSRRTVSSYIKILKDDGCPIQIKDGRKGGIFFIECKK